MSNLPTFAPEGTYDPSQTENYCSKSLYEQLQEQKNLKLKKFEEENSFKNSVKIYDDDDIAFVNEVKNAKLQREVEKANEVKALVELAKKREAERMSAPVNIYENIDEKIKLMRQNTAENEKMNLLKSILKRKREEESGESPMKIARVEATESLTESAPVLPESSEEPLVATNSGLPGMDAYNSDSSDSDSSDTSSDSDVDVGTLRPLIKRLTDRIKKNC